MMWVIEINEDNYYGNYNMAVLKSLLLAKQGKDVELYKIPHIVRERVPTMALCGGQGKVVVTCRIKIA